MEHALTLRVEKDFDTLTDLAAHICLCQTAVICVFDPELRLQAELYCSEELTTLLSQQKLLPGEINIFGSGPIIETKAVEGVLFYHAAVTLTGSSGNQMGALCLMNEKPFTLDEQQKKTLLLLAGQLSLQLINIRGFGQLKTALGKAVKFQALFNQSSEIHCYTDLEGKILYINDSVYRLLGYMPEETIGKTIWNFCVPGERERLRPEIYTSLNQGADRFRVETRTLTKAGELRWFEWSDVVKEDHWLINGRDITDRKQAELDARILGTAVERSSAAVFIRNTDMEVTWVNDAAEQLMGFSLKELEGKTFAFLFTGPDTHTAVYGNAESRVKENESYEIEVKVYKKDKSPVWLHVSNSSVYNQQGQVERIVSVAFDISDQKQTELLLVKNRDEAVRLSRAKESFLSVMSHEMRTPLNAIIGMSRILFEEEHLNHQQEHLDILNFSAQNLLTLINDVLDFTKIETGNMLLESQPVNLEKLVHNTTESLKPKAKEQGIDLLYEIAPTLNVHVYADPTRLYQILMNITGNAVKFTSKGHVKISLQLLDETDHDIKIGFAVNDTGIGIARDKLDSIFDAYTQAGADITRKYGGTGLGLAITKKLVGLYGSEIEVQSELGRGTTFAFSITFKKASSAELTITTAGSEQSLQGHVLVVDDSSVNRLVAAKILQKWKLTTDFAENGAEALEKVMAGRYNLVLMDIHMPVMNGFEVVKRIKAEQSEYFQNLPILALTGSVSDQEQQMIDKYGFSGYILKPFDTAKLYGKVKELLNW